MSTLQQKLQKTAGIIMRESMILAQFLSKQVINLTENWQNWNYYSFNLKNLKLVELIAVFFAAYVGYWILTVLRYIIRILSWTLYWVFTILQWIIGISFWVLLFFMGVRITLDFLSGKLISNPVLTDSWRILGKIKNYIVKIWQE